MTMRPMTLCISISRLLLLVGVAVAFVRPATYCCSTAERRCRAGNLSLFNGFGFDKGLSKEVNENEMFLIEKEVVANVQAQVDKKETMRAIATALSEPIKEPQSNVTPQWAIAVAASAAAGTASFFVVQNFAIGALVALGVGFVASRNPVEEADSAGAIARTVGD